MSEKPTIHVHFDTRPLFAAFDELKARRKLARTSDVVSKIRKFVAKPAKMISTRSYVRKEGRNGQSVVVFEPSKRFRKLLAELDAGACPKEAPGDSHAVPNDGYVAELHEDGRALADKGDASSREPQEQPPGLFYRCNYGNEMPIKVPDAFLYLVGDDGVSIRRYCYGLVNESYPPREPARAAVDAVSQIMGFQPPRDHRRLDKPVRWGD